MNKEVLKSRVFNIKVEKAGQEKKIIKELIGMINEKVSDEYKIPLDGEIDDSDMLRRICINETHIIRMWKIEQRGEKRVIFRVSLFVEETEEVA